MKNKETLQMILVVVLFIGMIICGGLIDHSFIEAGLIP